MHTEVVKLYIEEQGNYHPNFRKDISSWRLGGRGGGTVTCTDDDSTGSVLFLNHLTGD